MKNKFFNVGVDLEEPLTSSNKVEQTPLQNNKDISSVGERAFSFEQPIIETRQETVNPALKNDNNVSNVNQSENISGQNMTVGNSFLHNNSIDAKNQTIVTPSNIQNISNSNVGIPNSEETIANSKEVLQSDVNLGKEETFVAATVKKDDVSLEDLSGSVQMAAEVKNNVQLDPLNNANNPIPVNPIAPVVEEEIIDNVKVNPMIILNLLFDLVKKPGTTLTSYVNKYQGTKSALTLTTIITVFSLLLSLVMSLVTGGFIKNYNVTTGSYTTSYSFGNIFTQDFLRIIMISLMISGGLILVVSTVYFAASFFNSKGVNIGKCLMVCNVAFLPLIIGINALYPLGNVVSYYIGFVLLGATIIFSAILFITGMNECLKIDSLDKKIFYNLINMTIVFLIVVTVIFIFFYGEISFVPTNIY